MDARAHFLLRAAAVAVLVLEAAYPRPVRTTSVTAVTITAPAVAAALATPPAVVATR
jgi:hypothetical protein